MSDSSKKLFISVVGTALRAMIRSYKKLKPHNAFIKIYDHFSVFHEILVTKLILESQKPKFSAFGHVGGRSMKYNFIFELTKKNHYTTLFFICRYI